MAVPSFEDIKPKSSVLSFDSIQPKSTTTEIPQSDDGFVPYDIKSDNYKYYNLLWNIEQQELKNNQYTGGKERVGKQIYNATVASLNQGAAKGGIGESFTLINSLMAQEEDFQKRALENSGLTNRGLLSIRKVVEGSFRKGERISKSEQYKVANPNNRELSLKELEGIKGNLTEGEYTAYKNYLTGNLNIKNRTPEEDLQRATEFWERGKERTQQQADISMAVGEANGLLDKVVDITAGVVGLTAQLTVLRKAFPTTPEMVLWELQGQANGEKPGSGAVSYLALSTGKLVKGKGVVQGLKRTAVESASLATKTALETKISDGQINWEEVLTSAALPVALKTPALVKAGIRLGNREILIRVAQKRADVNLIKRLPSQRQMLNDSIAKGKLTEFLVDDAANTLYDDLLKGNKKVQQHLSDAIQGQGFPTLDSLYARVNQGDKVAATLIQDGMYAGSPEAYMEGLRVIAAKQIGVPYEPKSTRSTIEYANVGEAKSVSTEERPMGTSTFKDNPLVKITVTPKDKAPTTVELPLDAAVDMSNKTMNSWLDNAVVHRKTDVEEALHKFKQKQSSGYRALYKRLLKKGTGEHEASLKAKAAMTGQADVKSYEPPTLSDSQWNTYSIKAKQAYPLDKKPMELLNVNEAFDKIKRGIIPTPYEFGLLDKVFGRELTEKLAGKIIPKETFKLRHLFGILSTAYKTWKFGIEPQSLSQFATVKGRHPLFYLKHAKNNIKFIFQSLSSSKKVDDIEVSLEHSESYNRHTKQGWNFLKTASWDKNSPNATLEQYGGVGAHINLVEKIPLLGRWFKAVEKGSTAAINLGIEDFANIQERMMERQIYRDAKRGKVWTDTQKEAFIKERVKLGNALLKREAIPNKSVAQTANYVLTSSTYTWSKITTPWRAVAQLINGTSISDRSYGIQVMVAQIAQMHALGYIGSMIGNKLRAQDPTKEPIVDSSTNPADSLYGKIRVGNHVIDHTQGEATNYRTLIRLGLSAYKRGMNTTGHNISEVWGRPAPETKDVIHNYLVSKETPLLGLVQTLMTGKDWLGNDISASDIARTELPPGAINQIIIAAHADGIWEKIANQQETADGIKQLLTVDLGTGLAELGGLRVSTYPVRSTSTRAKFRDIIANKSYNKEWNDLSFDEQRELQSQYKTEFDNFEEKIKQEREENPSNLAILKEEEHEAGKTIKSKLNKSYKEVTNGIDLGISRRPKNYYLNDKRWNQYIDLTAKYLNEHLSQLDMTSMDDKQRRRRVENTLKMAKNRAFSEISQEE